MTLMVCPHCKNLIRKESLKEFKRKKKIRIDWNGVFMDIGVVGVIIGIIIVGIGMVSVMFK